jgi:peptidoglycan/LPS O-acetylase OafA/YrhL
MLEFLQGILLAGLLQRGCQRRIRLSTAVVLLAAGPGLLIAGGLHLTPERYGSPLTGLYGLAVLPGVCALVWAAATLDIARRPGWLACRPLVWLGECSFALYMTHALLFRVVGHSGQSRALVTVAALGLALPVAALAHHLVERPLERRLRAGRSRAGVRPRVTPP